MFAPGAGDGDPADQEALMEKFNEYLSKLKQDDPEQFDLLMADMQAARQQEQQEPRPELTEEQAQELLEQMQRAADPEGQVRTPGGEVMGEDGLAARDEGEEVQPEPGFVIKSVREDTGGKVFINVCVSDKVGVPAKKVKLDDKGEEQEGLNIPLSLGPPHADTDKAGAECTVFDVIVNPKVLEECDADDTGSYRSFVCELAIHYVHQKHEVLVSQRAKFPRMRYKGPSPCRRQRIRARKAPTIEEVGPRPKQQAAAAAAAAPARPKKPTEAMRYRLFERAEGADGFERVADEAEPGDGSARPAEYVLVVPLPLTAEPESVQVELSPQMVAVRADGYRALELLLAHPIDADAADVAFLADEKQLELRAPTREPDADSAEPDPGSNAWLLAQALAAEEPDRGRDGAEAGAGAEEPEAEADPFHLRAPAAAQPAGGATMADAPVQEEDELPEDRFHRSDLMSQHIIQQKQQQINDKREQARKDREELDNDPNITVERIGYDDEGKETKEAVELPPSATQAARIVELDSDGVDEVSEEAQEAAAEFAATSGASSLAFELL